MVNCDQDEDKKEETDLRHVFVQFMADSFLPPVFSNRYIKMVTKTTVSLFYRSYK